MKRKSFLLIMLIIFSSVVFVSVFTSKSNTSGTNILITEVLYDTPGTDSVEEWIELYNPTSVTIDLSGWTISDNAGSFSLSGSLGAYGFLVLARDPTGFFNLYGFYPDVIIGDSLALSNSGDQVVLKDAGGVEIDFVAWENYVSGWTVSAVHTTIYRVSVIDTDTVTDWADSGTLGTPGTGDYSSGTDTTPPVVTITSPSASSTVSGTINVIVNATDTNGITNYEILIDNTLVATTSTYSWDTTTSTDGSHTILARAKDGAGNWGEDAITVTVDNSNPPAPSTNAYKVMTYNIEQSGVNPDWKQVVKEENPDIAVFIETGDWDDNNNALLNQYLTEFNTYFVNEAPYHGVTTQNIAYSTSGEAVFSRYPIINWTQIPLVTLDDGTSYDVSHDFLDVVVDINSVYVHVIAAHLKCCSGTTNEDKRERAQEGIINYMDALGNVPIMFMGDLNSFSPQDTGALAPNGDLGYGPMSMMLRDDTFGTYSIYSSTLHTYTDVFRTLNPNDPGYTYGHQNPTYASRIDFLLVNQFFNGLLINSTVGDTPTADTGSDHYAVDVFLNPFGSGSSDTTPPAQVTGLKATAVSGSQINLSWDANTEPDLSAYHVYRDGALIFTTTSTSYNDTGLTSETTYTYQVSAIDTSGNEGVQSNPVNATTLDITPPTQVINVQVTSITSTNISLSWDANTEPDLCYYKIYRDGVSIGTTTVNSFIDTGLTQNTTYTYEISAVDCSGNEGARSNPISATTAMLSSIDHVVISEVYYDATGNDRSREWIELYNPTNQVIDLTGWTISDGAGTTFTLSGVINPGQHLVIARSLQGFYDFYGFNADLGDTSIALGNRGDSVTLKDASGNVIDFVAWENYVNGWNITAKTGQSIARKDYMSDSDTVNDWIVLSNEGTPGY